MTDSTDKPWSQMKWATSLSRWIFPTWFSLFRSAPRAYRWVFWVFALVTLPCIGWVIIHSKSQSLARVGEVTIQLWSVMPGLLKLLLMLSGMLFLVLIAWTLILQRQQWIQVPRLKSNRILDDFESYLDGQLPSHAQEMEATSVRISYHFPANVGVQGAEIRAQIEVAKRMCQAIEQRWKNDHRCIQDAYPSTGLRAEVDLVIARRVSATEERIRNTLQRIEEAVASRYFHGAKAPDFEQVWSTVHVSQAGQ